MAIQGERFALFFKLWHSIRYPISSKFDVHKAVLCARQGKAFAACGSEKERTPLYIFDEASHIEDRIERFKEIHPLLDGQEEHKFVVLLFNNQTTRCPRPYQVCTFY